MGENNSWSALERAGCQGVLARTTATTLTTGSHFDNIYLLQVRVRQLPPRGEAKQLQPGVHGLAALARLLRGVCVWAAFPSQLCSPPGPYCS